MSAGLRLLSSTNVSTALVGDERLVWSGLAAAWYQQIQKLISVVLQLTLKLKEYCGYVSTKLSAFQRKIVNETQFAIFQNLLGNVYSLYIYVRVCV